MPTQKELSLIEIMAWIRSNNIATNEMLEALALSYDRAQTTAAPYLAFEQIAADLRALNQKWFYGLRSTRTVGANEFVHGRKPIAGVDYDPDKPMCQDDYEYYTGADGFAAILQK